MSDRKEFIISMLIFSVIGFILSACVLYYIWFAATPTVVRIIGTVIMGGLLIFCGRSLWLNFIRPMINRLKDKIKKKSE